MKKSNISTSSALPLQRNVKNLVCFFEESKFLEQVTIFDELAKQKVPTQIYFYREKVPEQMKRSVQQLFFYQQPLLATFSMMDVSNILKQQLVGTHLFISGKWPFIQTIKEQAYHAGFSENEMTAFGTGPKEEKVFCVKCYSYNFKKQGDEMSCEHCHIPLQISNHFSKRHNAYLGYIKIS